MSVSVLFGKIADGPVKGLEEVNLAGLERNSARRFYRSAAAISWPAAVEGALIAIGNSIDTAVVGMLGTVAMNAVGIVSQPRMIAQCFVLSLNVGVTAVISRYKGAEDRRGANRCLKRAIVLSALISLVPTLLAACFAWPLLEFAGAQPEYIGDSVRYFRTVLFGLYFYCVGLTICAAQRGVGNTKVSLAANLSANAVRVVLAYALISGRLGLPAMGIRGAAIASMVSYIVGFLVALLSALDKREYINIRNSDSWRDDGSLSGSMLRVGASALAEQFFMRFGMLMYVRLVSQLGTVEYTSYIVCDSILSIAYCVSLALGDADSALVGQSLGAEKKEMAVIYNAISQRICFAISAAFAVICLLFRSRVIRVFSQDPLVIRLASRLMIAVALISLIQSFLMILSGSLRGGGDTRYVAFLSLISLAILRPIFSWGLIYPLGLGIYGAWIAMFLDQAGRFILLRRRFNSGGWLSVRL